MDLAGKLMAFAKANKLVDSETISKGDVKLKDVLNNTDLSRLVPIAISEIVREASEFELLATKLFKKISQKEGIYIQLPAVGAMDTVEEVPAGAEYGTENITMGGGTAIRIDIRKYGIKLGLTEEMVENSQWDVIGEWLKAAGKAFARKKNNLQFNMFERQGLTLVDNKNPANTVLGRALSGKDGAGNLNYSFTNEDFFDIYAAMLQEGFAPKVVVVHPMTWAIWVKDPILRAFAFTRAGGPFMNQFELGGVKRDSFFGGLGKSSGGADAGEDVPPDFQGRPILPPYLNVPLQIMVSPQVPFNPVEKTTSMYFVDTDNAGAIVQGEEINHHSWGDPERDIYRIKLREKYGISMLNEGRGVGVVKNVPIVPNRFVENAQVTIAAPEKMYPEDMAVTDKLS
jgi:hypothetical protein